MTGKQKYTARLMYLQITKRLVILNAKRERIRNPLERETDCHSRLRGFAMTGKQKYTARLMCLQITKRLVILNA